MTDGIIKGTGNSRYLKTATEALSLYPTYEAFMEALVAGTFPIDLNGVNAAGWTQQGTPLNKENLLKDATAALCGLDSTAVPDDVLVAIKSRVDKNTEAIDAAYEFVYGSYVGSNTTSKSLTFAKQIEFIMLYGFHQGGSLQSTFTLNVNPLMVKGVLTTTDQLGRGFGQYDTVNLSRYGTYGRRSEDGKTFYWMNYESNNTHTLFNASGYTYVYIACLKGG